MLAAAFQEITPAAKNSSVTACLYYLTPFKKKSETNLLKAMINIQTTTSTRFDFFHSEMWMDNGILFTRYKPDLIIDLTVAREIVRDRVKAMENQNQPIYTDTSELIYIDTHARKYLASTIGSMNVKANALFANDPLLMVILNAQIILDKSTVPMRVFKSETEALKWLDTYKESYSSTPEK